MQQLLAELADKRELLHLVYVLHHRGITNNIGVYSATELSGK